jgi:hypothetical protein
MDAHTPWSSRRSPHEDTYDELLYAGEAFATLTEPEDRTFRRDLAPVVTRLNQYEDRVVALTRDLAALQAHAATLERERDDWHLRWHKRDRELAKLKADYAGMIDVGAHTDAAQNAAAQHDAALLERAAIAAMHVLKDWPDNAEGRCAAILVGDTIRLLKEKNGDELL